MNRRELSDKDFLNEIYLEEKAARVTDIIEDVSRNATENGKPLSASWIEQADTTIKVIEDIDGFLSVIRYCIPLGERTVISNNVRMIHQWLRRLESMDAGLAASKRSEIMQEFPQYFKK